MGLETRLMVMGRVRAVEGASWVEGEGEAGVEQLRTMLRTNQAFLASMGSGGEHLGMVRELSFIVCPGKKPYGFSFSSRLSCAFQACFSPGEFWSTFAFIR